MPLTCELGNIFSCNRTLCMQIMPTYGRRHPRYHFGNTNLNITTNKSSNKRIFWHSTICVT